MVEQFVLEAKVQSYFETAWLVRQFGLFEDCEHIYLLLEYLEGGTLYAELKRQGRLPQQRRARGHAVPGGEGAARPGGGAPGHQAGERDGHAWDLQVGGFRVGDAVRPAQDDLLRDHGLRGA
jgi:hypothetical protein